MGSHSADATHPAQHGPQGREGRGAAILPSGGPSLQLFFIYLNMKEHSLSSQFIRKKVSG
jgi:hypothetical protein